MKGIFLIFIFNLASTSSFANCNLSTPNDILNLIRKNHPQISINKARGAALVKTIDVAKQRPNPELDAETNVGDSLEGNIYTTSLSLKHTFELGGKRGARVKVAENRIKSTMAMAKHQNQEAVIDTVLKLHRLRQIHELIPLYDESLDAFNKILRSIKKRKSLSPEQEVEGVTLELAANDYKLKIAKLSSEKISLSKHLTYFIGVSCIIPKNALPTKVDLTVNFKETGKINDFSKLEAASFALDLAKSNLELEKSNSWPDLQIGPSYSYEKLNVSTTNTIGITLTMDLPIFNVNGGGRARANKQVYAARLNYNNIKKESELDIESWISKYNQYKQSLKVIANKEKLEKKHKKIEELFKRGIISTSLVIESHRQLIEFSKTRYEFETSAAEALWNIYKLNGQIDKIKL